jgi:2-oxoisovalerate dehydrogenase E2 component (dihydrolipoyl transacylase)
MKIFYLPDLGEGLADAEIREWYVHEGDTVTVDQPLVSMETAKAVVDVPSPYAGKILTLHGAPNQVIQTGAPFVTFELAGEVSAHLSGSVVGALPESGVRLVEMAAIVGAVAGKQRHTKVMPAARVLAQALGVDLTALQGSGPQGLITVQDVQAALSPSHQSSSNGGEVLHGARRMMALAMAQSHQEVVPVTLMEDVDITHLAKGADLTVMLLQAMVHACQVEPTLNAWFDGKTLEKKQFNEVNIGLAVDTALGLFVPVIKDAATCDQAQLRKTIDAYKQGAEARSLSPVEMQGATITLSNFGSIVGKYATPIIVPPQVAILGCGRHRLAPVCQGEIIRAGRLLPLSLTIDHRAVTGGEASRFLAAIVRFLSKA